MAGQERESQHRSAPMEVLVLGLPRTGTSSMRQALHDLGYSKVYHFMTTLLERPKDCEAWVRALKAKFEGVGTFDQEDWDFLLGDYMAVTDYPASIFAAELLQAYPNAKIILTQRDSAEAWYKSITTTIWPNFERRMRYLRLLGPLFEHLASPYAVMVEKMFRYTEFRGDVRIRNTDIYHDHNGYIRRLVPADKLLLFNVKDGWQPLCAHLGKEVPKHAFPNVNEAAMYHKRVASSRTVSQNVALAPLLLLLGGVVLSLIAVIFLTIKGCTHYGGPPL